MGYAVEPDETEQEPANRRCILTGAELTPENDSKAHIIPSALGGRLKPTGLLSRNANTVLDEKADDALITRLAPIMTWLGAKRDRGENQPVKLAASDGTNYVFDFDAPLALDRPDYRENIKQDGTHEVFIKARTMKELRTIAGRLKKQYPHLDMEAFLQQAKPTQQRIENYLRLSFDLSPAAIFPAAYTSLVLFAAHRLGFVPAAWRPYIEALDPASPAEPPETFFFYPGERWLLGGDDSDVPHKIVLHGRKESGVLFGYLELFGIVQVGAVLSRNFNQDIQEVYGYDLLAQKEFQDLRIDDAVFGRLSISATSLSDARAQVSRRLVEVMRAGAKLQESAAVGRIVNQVLGKVPRGAPIPPAAINELAARVIEELVVPRLSKPKR